MFMGSVTSGYTSILISAFVKTPVPTLLSEIFAFTGRTHPDVAVASHAPELPFPPWKFVIELLAIEYVSDKQSPVTSL